MSLLSDCATPLARCSWVFPSVSCLRGSIGGPASLHVDCATPPDVPGSSPLSLTFGVEGLSLFSLTVLLFWPGVPRSSPLPLAFGVPLEGLSLFSLTVCFCSRCFWVFPLFLLPERSLHLFSDAIPLPLNQCVCVFVCVCVRACVCVWVHV